MLLLSPVVYGHAARGSLTRSGLRGASLRAIAPTSRSNASQRRAGHVIAAARYAHGSKFWRSPACGARAEADRPHSNRGRDENQSFTARGSGGGQPVLL